MRLSSWWKFCCTRKTICLLQMLFVTDVARCFEYDGLWKHGAECGWGSHPTVCAHVHCGRTSFCNKGGVCQPRCVHGVHSRHSACSFPTQRTVKFLGSITMKIMFSFCQSLHILPCIFLLTLWKFFNLFIFFFQSLSYILVV